MAVPSPEGGDVKIVSLTEYFRAEYIDTQIQRIFSNSNDLEVAHPHTGSTSTIPSRIGIWKCWFLSRGENWRKKLSEQGREQTTNSIHIFEPGHNDERRMLSPLRYSYPHMNNPRSWLVK